MAAPTSFASLDDRAWPVVVVRYAHVNPSAEEQTAYFGALARILNDRATPASRCAFVFDASAITVTQLLNLNYDFFAVHTEFNKLYHERFEGVCRGFGIVVPNTPILSGLIKAALTAAPTSHPCRDFGNVADAVSGMSGAA